MLPGKPNRAVTHVSLRKPEKPMKIQKFSVIGIVLAIVFTIIFTQPHRISRADARTNTVNPNETLGTCRDAKAPESDSPQGSCCTWSQDLSSGQGNGQPGTGLNGTAVIADPLWKFNNATAYIITNMGTMSYFWIVMPPARWIQKVNYPKPAGAQPGKYKFTITFNVPNCPDGRVRLTGSFAADNNAKAYLDGTPIPGASCAGPNCFKAPDAPISLNGAPVIAPGQHTLLIEVGNTGSAPSYFGLIVNAKLTRSCP
jgi:hypothetical protein